MFARIIEGPEDLSSAMRDARLAAGLNQADLAELHGLSRFTLINVESGQGDPRLSTIVRLLHGLGLRAVLVPAAFADRVSVPVPAKEPDGEPLDEESLDLLWDEERVI